MPRSGRKRSEPGEPADVLQSAAVALRDLMLAGDLFRARIAEHMGVGVREVVAVSHLQAHDQLTPAELARELHMSAGAVTSLVDRLERAGFAAREPDVDDLRRTWVRLTDGGRQLVLDVRRWARACFDDVDDLPGAVAAMHQIGAGLRAQHAPFDD